MQQFGPTEILFNLTPETCLESNGVVQIDSVVGGTPEFSMDLNGIPILNNLFTDLSPGAYTLNVMDANLCSLDTSFLIESIPPVEVSAIVSQLPTCNGYNNGSADAVISAGMAPFTFLWSQGSSDSIAINLFTGTYSVTASDANGCIDTDTVFVTEPTPIEFNQSLIHPVCGDSNGSIIIDSAWGGTLPYSFSLDTMNWQINNEFNNLGEAIYTTYLRDAQNCLHSSAIELITPSYPVELTTESMDAVCSENNGSISLLGISGGTGQMQVSFNNSDWLNIDSFPFGFTQLDQGAYQIEIIDMNGCRLDTTLSLLRFPGPDEITFEIINATCSLNNSSITVTNINSGTFPFVFHLNDTPSANGVFENLNPGDYSLLITDANGCNSDTLASTIAIEDVSIEIFQLIPVSCAGYSDAVLTAAVETGIQPFSLTWNTGYSGYQQDSLPAGDYSVIVSDANGCLDTAFHSIPDPPQVHIQVNGPEDVCEGESITLNAEAGGGTGHLEIFWPEFNLFGESMSEVPQQSKMYHAEVADANGCSANDSSYLLLRLNPSGSIIPDITEGCSPVCVNLRLESADSSDLTEYLWDFSNLDQSATSTPQYCFEESGMQNISLRITDAFGCSSTLHAENLISVYPVPEARFSFTPNEADVINPLIQFLDESENAATWNWTFSDGGVSVEQNPEHTFPDTGNYSACLKVSSSYGCESFICKSLEISPYPSLFAPNAFTPNGDGTNDIFVVKMKYIDKYFLEIFNRWGELLYETRDQNSGWDGLYMERKCQEDVYVWRVTYTDIQRKSDQIIGRVTLIE
jgi:gliding motility-associated-like protein